MGAYSKQNIVETLKSLPKKILFYIPRLINGTRFIFVYGHEFITKGGIYITTNLFPDSQNQNSEGQLCFETLIQPDGDVLDFIPAFDSSGNNIIGSQAFISSRKSHTDKLNKIMNEMNGVQYIADLIALLLSCIYILFIEKSFSDSYKQYYIIHSAGVVILFYTRKNIFQRLFPYLIKISGKIFLRKI